MVKEEDFKEYDVYKNVKDSKKILDRIMREKPMFHTIYYWDSTFNNVMVEVDLKNYNKDKLEKNIEKLRKVHDIFKKGYIDKDMITDAEEFELLREYFIAAAFRYNLIKRKPFILLYIKYDKLNDFELKCIFEYLIHTNLYLNAVRHRDPILYVKVGWWMIKDIIDKYKKTVELGKTEYDYEGEYKW